MPSTADQIRESVDRTVAWAARGLVARDRLRDSAAGAMALFGINQGSVVAAEPVL